MQRGAVVEGRFTGYTPHHPEIKGHKKRWWMSCPVAGVRSRLSFGRAVSIVVGVTTKPKEALITEQHPEITYLMSVVPNLIGP